MSNTDRPRGAIPVGTLSGSPVSGTIRRYPVDSSNATAIFRGDFVKLEADGNVAPAAAGDVLLGVALGPVVDRAIPATEHPGYLPATTAGYVRVAVGPDILYEVQEDSVGGDMTAAMVGANGNIAAGAGSTTTGVSGHELDSSDVTTNNGSAATAQLRVVALVDREDNAVGTNAKWLVRINEHHFGSSGVAGI